MISRIFRPLIEGFRGVFRHAAMSISSAVTVMIALMIIGIFALFTIHVERFTRDLEESVNISVLVDYDYESASQEDKLSLEIQAIPEVDDVRYSSKADEFKYYLESFSDEKTKEAFEPFKDDNPMHDAFYVTVHSGTQLEAVSKKIEALEGVYKVNYGGTSAVQLVTMLRAIRYIGGGIALALALLAIFLIQNTINMTITARSDEIAIMRNVGAKNGFILMPFLIEGMLIGILGSIIPILLMVFGYINIYRFTGGYVISTMFDLMPPQQISLLLSCGLLSIGCFVGFMGALVSVRKNLRWTR